MRLKVSLNLLLGLFLTGCGSGESFKSTESIVGQGWAAPPEPYAPPPLYCYKTLGSVDCHRMPLKNGETRLQGYYGGPRHTPEEVESSRSFFSFFQSKEFDPVQSDIQTSVLPAPTLPPASPSKKMLNPPLDKARQNDQMPLSLRK